MFENEKFDKILTILKDNGVILFPTDTIWGIGCDATNEEAVQKVSTIKNRKNKNGYVLLVDSLEMLRNYVSHVHPRIETLLHFHDRPLTVIYDEGLGLAPSVLGNDGSVAIRIVKDAFCRELIQQFGKPLVATSANITGNNFPTHYGEINSDVLEQVDFVVKFKQDHKTHGEPSVIVRLNEAEELDFIRE